MPINKEKSQRISVTFTKEEYKKLLKEVQREKKQGRKMTASKYIAGIMREHWATNQFFSGNGG